MKIKILSVGSRMPSWVTEGTNEYSKRLPRDIKLELIEIPLGNRGKNADISKAIQKESDALLGHIADQDWVVALEVTGQSWSTEKLAEQFSQWRLDARDVVILIGGPDGLSAACRQRANQQWSLSKLTYPHPVVRIVLAEQLYRAWTITQNHPYHRA